jgi:signal transduction histidine kinase/CheY-like chemotaxis protein
MRTEERSTRDQIQSEQIRTLFSQTSVAVAVQFFIGTVIVALSWETAPRELLAGWLSMLFLASIGRVMLSRYYLRHSPPAGEWRRWAAAGVAVISLFALIWGAASILFLDMSDPVRVVVIVTVIVSVNAGSASTTASYPASFYAFAAITYVPTIWILIASGTATGIALTLLVGASVPANAFICLNVNKVLERSLRLGFENESLRREAERANAAKTRFLAAASHDLRQPIHALGLSFAALSDKVRSPETQPVIDQVEGSIDAVDTMLNALLDISKLDAGVVSPCLESIPVADLIRQLNSEFLSMAGEQGNTLVVRSSDTWVRSDPRMLQRILRNFLANALRYTSNGRVLLAARRRHGKVRFEVRDTGMGIPADRFDDIFLEFQQLGNPQRDRRQGLGLGLAIVKRLAHLLNHPIGLSSTFGRGSCFWVEVPLVDGPATEERPTGHEPNSRPVDQLSGARVLVLDDEAAILESMRTILENWGCDVVLAATVDEAVSVAGSKALDLLIVDYRLAGETTGLDAVSRVRRSADTEIPALVITGDTAPERLREARKSGYPLLHKPVQPARLRSAMQHVMRGRVST